MHEEKLLDDVTALLNDPAINRPIFNPASLLIRREADLSRILAWMLDPRGSHNEGATFLLMFLDIAGLKEVSNPASARVRLEVPLFSGSILVGRIDIQVLHKDFLLLIESKPTASLGDKQLERYLSSLVKDTHRQDKVVFLPGNGFSGETLSKINSDVIILKLSQQVIQWVSGCLDLSHNPKVKQFLSYFLEDLKINYAGEALPAMTKLVDLMVATPDTVAAAITISDAKDGLLKRVMSNFIKQVETKAKTAGVGDIRPIIGEPTLYYSKEYGCLRLNIGSPYFDFAIQADGANFQNVAIGVLAHKEMPNLNEHYAIEIAKLTRSFGPGSTDGTVNKHWLWWKYVAELDTSGSVTDNRAAPWKWAADMTDDGLAALFVRYAKDAKLALGL